MKEKSTSFSVSSIEFDKVQRIRIKRESMGYSKRDLSFLLGYRSLYVRDIENPLLKLRYTSKDTNYLLAIFDCELPDIMTGKISDENYHITVEPVIIGEITYYKIFRENQLINPDFEQEITGLQPIEDNTLETAKVERFIQDLFDGDFFSSPKTALEIFNQCKHEFKKQIHPQIVSVIVGKYTGKRKAPRLIKDKNDSSRTVYKKEL